MALRVAFVSTLVGAILSACVTNPRPARVPFGAVPDMSGILRLSDANGGVAHGCPVGAMEAFTNAHVTKGETGFMWSTRDGIERGYATPTGTSLFADLATIEPVTVDGEGAIFPRWYEVAREAPRTNDQVFFVGYDFDTRKGAFSEHVFTTKVLRVIAGLVIMENAGIPGSSGSCVLLADGTVVAINKGGTEIGHGGAMVGVAVGLWSRYGANH